VDHLIPRLKKIFGELKLARDIQIHRKKCTHIIKKIIAPTETSEVVKIIQTQPFSILVDKSTDICMNKFLCVLVRFVHPCTLYRGYSNSAFGTCKFRCYCLRKKNIPISNIIGVASDGANVMIGENSSFVSRLKSLSPNLILMRCICHSSALIANKSCKMLPRSTEDLIRSVASYVAPNVVLNL